MINSIPFALCISGVLHCVSVLLYCYYFISIGYCAANSAAKCQGNVGEFYRLDS